MTFMNIKSTNMIQNGFIIHPYHELLPDYKICPFSTVDIVKNKQLPESNYIDEYFQNRFGENHFTYTINGREAIALSLSHFQLKATDCVTILTTTGNFYISSCVTSEIEKHCQWSRNIESNTKVLFVNHEFGFPYENIAALKKYNIPIIEDCAHSFFSQDANELTGKVGDFVIYSFPKMFPIQVGGLLVANIDCAIKNNISSDLLQYIKNCLSFYIMDSAVIIETRRQNYNYLAEICKDLQISERFELTNNNTPGVFMFKSQKHINYVELKLFLYKHGIQCSVFYGEESFFIPIHQNLTFSDLDYFKTVIKTFINN
jgi:hypothetical protein